MSTRWLAPFCLSLALTGACGGPDGSDEDPVFQRGAAADPLSGLQELAIKTELAAGHWDRALRMCTHAQALAPGDCEARYCELLARTMLFVDEVNDFLLPRFRTRKTAPTDVLRLLADDVMLAHMSEAADAVIARNCSFDLPHLPVRLGEAAEPFLVADARGRWTPRTAHSLGAVAESFRYLLGSLLLPPLTTPRKWGETDPGLPVRLGKLKEHLDAQDELLFSERVDPQSPIPRGGWHDRNGNGIPDAQDELRLDLFVPGTDQRALDFSAAELVVPVAPPRAPLTETAALPAPRCGYKKWHIDTLLRGTTVGADGMTFSPDGTRLLIPIQVDGTYQIHAVDLRGSVLGCLTCTGPGAATGNDGVRWRPGPGDWVLFVSNRDHAFAVGGSAGGFGQELYAMRPDGTEVTRLTTSPAYATNYHPNWSHDGARIVWGSTAERTWDILVADFATGPDGPRLENTRRLTRDTTWWESHGFSADGRAVLVTGTRAGFQSADLYALDLDGTRRRLTDDLGWDEHGHLSPDGRKLAWISSRFHPASVRRLTSSGGSPVFDFFWIAPGILSNFLAPPAGFRTELTLADADGNAVQQLTRDGKVVADNQWSPDGTRIVFRQTEAKLLGGETQIRVLTFDDCR